MPKITDTQAQMIRNMAEDGVTSPDKYVEEIGLPIAKIKYHAKKLGVKLPLERTRLGSKKRKARIKKAEYKHRAYGAVLKVVPGEEGVPETATGAMLKERQGSMEIHILQGRPGLRVKCQNCGTSVDIFGEGV